MQHFFLRGNAEELFFDAFARADLRDLIARGQFIVYPLGSREHAHAGRAEGLEQRAVFKLAHHIRLDAQSLKPLIKPAAHSRLCGGQ